MVIVFFTQYNVISLVCEYALYLHFIDWSYVSIDCLKTLLSDNMPPIKWTATFSTRLWNKRSCCLVEKVSDVRRKNEERLSRIRIRQREQRAKRQQFVQRYRERSTLETTSTIFTKETKDLQFWIEHQSWSYCSSCRCLEPQKMLPSFSKRNSIRPLKTCSCSSGRYVIPDEEDIPLILLDLTEEQVQTLRPFEIDDGPYQRRQYGYRIRTDPFRVSWSKKSVLEKIHNIADTIDREKASLAYQLLMTRKESSYSKFVNMRDSNVRDPWPYEIYSNPVFRGIECALWPAVYHKTELCESIISGNVSRQSGKVAFQKKVFGPVIDYAISYQMLHYQYDRWLFKTITGAINTARQSHCSPARALEDKSFSYQYWQWQHRVLIDAVHQFGYPSFFVTISPFEWTFPFPQWLHRIREMTGRGPTDLPMLETAHITHVLEQVVRGHLCGSNTKRWRQHLFSNTTNPMSRNVETFFYRFEFQGRGTVHMHLLVWLKDMTRIRAELIQATIPWSIPNDAYHVADLQSSDSTVLPVQNLPSHFQETNTGTRLNLQYTEEDRTRKIRAYITTLLGALSCRTDVQCTDGRGMVLRYVSSYVSKCHDGATSEALYSKNLGGYQAAASFLRTMQPLEPEMYLQLTSTKMAWTPSRTKRMTAVGPGGEENVAYQKYLRRHESDRDLS
ncbi:hypothetical protein OS493_019947 [Desmophyllum pertusum]|uniref:Helitron helicase-like domain-containing protein n=1 Tax=Desmophyllum pertusum TaxID=174260 RepID=A0A9X0CM68_9CNID|nr:hypothetical protein OS493_019947 [Desmophyllum pertusum]